MEPIRLLTDNELSYLKKQLKNTRRILFWAFMLIVVIVGITAMAVYTSNKADHIIIDLMFGILILLVGALHWIFKGYKTHNINPMVYRNSGFYKRIYESHGKNGAYYDTINGVKVKLPWHWRNYLKKYDGQITYKYIIRDGAVAVNEHAIYVISVNNKLSLEYELTHGLKKVKRLNFINIVSFFLVLPTAIFMFANRNLSDALMAKQLFQTPKKDCMVLNSVNELSKIESSCYIKIKEAWVYQFKRTSDYLGTNYVLSKAERDRIYNHPSSNFDYRFFVPSKYITQPNKQKFKENLLNNPFSKNTLFKSADSTTLNWAIDMAFENQLNNYNKRLKRAKKAEKLLTELKPESYVLKIYDDTFNAPKERLSSIKESLEQPYIVEGFYIPDEKRLLSIEEHERQKDVIKSAVIFCIVCFTVIILSVLGLVKIIRNTIIKKQLVKTQLLRSAGTKQLPERR